MILSHGTYPAAFARRCWASQQAYAERLGVPYVQVYTRPEPYATQRKLEVIDQRGPAAGRVLYLDHDVEIAPDAEDVFSRADRFVMFPKYFPGTPRENGPNAGMLLGNVADLRAMRPAFDVSMNRLWKNPAREELATHEAARSLGICIGEWMPRGFHHHQGTAKWRAFRPAYPSCNS